MDNEVSVRWHSLSMAGMDEEGKRHGRPKEWIEVKMLDAYGSCGVGPGTAKGYTFGYDLGERGCVLKWWISGATLRAARNDDDAFR